MRISGLDRFRGILLSTPAYGERVRWSSSTDVAALAVRAVLSVVQLRSHSLTNLLGGPAIAALTCVLPRLARRAAVAA